MSVVVLEGVVKSHLDKNPTNASRYVITGLLPVDQVVHLQQSPTMPWCNPRLGFSDQRGTDKSRVAKDIRSSLEDMDGSFHERNRSGISMIADSAVLDDGIVTIDFGTPSAAKRRGLGDGGTTTMVICSAVQDGFEQSKDKSEVQYVKITIYCGDYSKAEVDSMVEAWNTNLQVDRFSLANQRHEFQWLKDVLDNKNAVRPFPKVSYFFGDNGDYDVADVVQILCTLAMGSGEGDREEAARVYSGFGGCLDFYQEDMAKGRDSIIRKLEPLIYDILYLAEIIPAEMPKLYNTVGGKFMALDLIKSKKSSRLPFIDTKIDYTPHKAWVLPILSAFRGNLDLEGPKAKWVVAPPTLILRDTGAELFEIVNKTFINESRNFNSLGRNKSLYARLADRVETFVTKAVAKGRYAKVTGGTSK